MIDFSKIKKQNFNSLQFVLNLIKDINIGMKAFQVLPPNTVLLPLVDPKRIDFTFFSLSMIQPKLVRIPSQKMINEIVKQNLNKNTRDLCKLTPVKLHLDCLHGLFKTVSGQTLKIRNEFVKFQIHEKYGIVKNQIPIKITVKPNGEHKIQLKRNQMIEDEFI